MPILNVLVDYDNVEPVLRSTGPTNLAKSLLQLVPGAVIARHDRTKVRLYGGWRCQGTLTTSAQRLVPDIQAGSPFAMTVQVYGGPSKQVPSTIELADKPIGTTIQLSETLARDRPIRKFRVRPNPWAECSDCNSCSLNHLVGAAYNTQCGRLGCTAQLGNLFVRDEQKMVDTLIVADIAHLALSEGASDLVVVSSDIDMWPGVMLALRKGCRITHIHTKVGWKTQRHLTSTLGAQLGRFYEQISPR